MDTNERFAEFRNSLPQDQREVFDSLLSRCRQLHVQTTACAPKKEGEKTGSVRLPSFPPPAGLPEHFLRELDTHPLVLHLRIKQEADKEISAWTAGCCQYLGSFLELNADNPSVTLAHCHLNRLSIEACVRLLYLSASIQDDKRSARYFSRFSSAVATAFPPPEGSRSEDLFEVWKQHVFNELHLLISRREEHPNILSTPKPVQQVPEKHGCLSQLFLIISLLLAFFFCT